MTMQLEIRNMDRSRTLIVEETVDAKSMGGTVEVRPGQTHIAFVWGTHTLRLSEKKEEEKVP